MRTKLVETTLGLMRSLTCEELTELHRRLADEALEGLEPAEAPPPALRAVRGPGERGGAPGGGLVV